MTNENVAKGRIIGLAGPCFIVTGFYCCLFLWLLVFILVYLLNRIHVVACFRSLFLLLMLFFMLVLFIHIYKYCYKYHFFRSLFYQS